jgi:hypothetical protein
MVSIELSSILTIESFGDLLNSSRVKQVRVSPPEFSFNNSFSNDFAIGLGFRLDRVVRSILNGSILSLEAFGTFIFPKVFFLYGIPSRESFGTIQLNYLYLYGVGTLLYVVDEAKSKRLEQVAIKKISLQKVNSIGSIISGSSYTGSPYKNWNGEHYSIIYEDTLGRYWEEKELTKDPESFFGWYDDLENREVRKKEVVSVSSLGKRKKNIDWSKAKLFSRRMAEKGILQQIKVKKASIRKGNMLIYFDEKNNSWEENELVFETMATMLIEKFKKKQKEGD